MGSCAWAPNCWALKKRCKRKDKIEEHEGDHRGLPAEFREKIVRLFHLETQPNEKRQPQKPREKERGGKNKKRKSFEKKVIDYETCL